MYGAKEWTRPCPSHVICSVLKSLDDTAFCKAMPQEDPFTASGEQPIAAPGSGSPTAQTDGTKTPSQNTPTTQQNTEKKTAIPKLP